jgi:hypothetical protein
LRPAHSRHAEILERIGQLEKQLALSPPSGQSKEILKELPVTLDSINDFEPAKFKSTMDELAELLK